MARLRDRLVGHGETWDHLVPALQAPELALTLLFAGPSGVGKKFAARAVIQALFCERNSGACGQCGSCLRVEQGTHEGLLEISPDGTQIKAEQARQVLEFLQLRSWGRRRAVLIDEAQLLNPQAANSLLKSLEEPPEGTFFFLIAPSPAALLPTLRSRSRAVLFHPLKEAELQKLQPAPAWAVKAARGSLERLRDLLNPEEAEIRVEASGLLERFLTEPQFLSSSGWRELIKERSRAHRVLDHWLTFVRDAWIPRDKSLEGLRMNPDLLKIQKLLAEQAEHKREKLTESLLRAEVERRFNRDPVLSIEEMWWHWREA